MSNAASAKPHVDAGALRALAVTSRGRLAAMADVPSVAEAAGVPDYEVLSWFAMFAPAGTPEPIVARLQGEIAALLNMPETRARLTGEGAEPVASRPKEFAEFVRAEIKKWDEVGKAANIQPTE
jgi:tripartite-type tricarboxylate transporter receptor subunit TctC